MPVSQSPYCEVWPQTNRFVSSINPTARPITWQRPNRAPASTLHKLENGFDPERAWQYLRGWARHLVVVDQPDLVITYTDGDAKDLEKLFIELRTHTTADIIVPSLHWRERDHELWGNSEND